MPVTQSDAYRTRPAPTDSDWTDLLGQVRSANPQPNDALDTSALLESLGWTDRQAADRYGFPDVFAMGRAVHADIAGDLRRGELRPRRGMPWLRLVGHLLAQLPHGFAFALPIVISFAAMLTLRVSLQSYRYFDVLQATALALATFLSFLATGGFVQAMANSVHLFLNMRETALARATAWRLMRWGMVTSVALAAAMVVGDLLLPVLPLPLVLFMDIYLILLSALWLSFAGLYVLRSEHWLSVITAGGVLVTYALWRWGLPVVLAQGLALTMTAVAASLTSIMLLRRLAARNPNRGTFLAPRASQLAYLAWPYFLYGVVYFLFIFVDRLIAWSTTGGYMPYAIWFRGQYELGMDWALLVLVLPMGAVEVLIHYIVQWLQWAQGAYAAENTAGLAGALRRVYAACAAGFAASAAGSIVLTQAVLGWARGVPTLARQLPAAAPEPFVLHMAMAAYIGVAAGLFNVLVMFSLLMPWPALRLIGVSIALDFVVGLVVTRVTSGYQYAVWGLLVAAVFFVVSTTVQVLRLMPRVDYLLFRMV